MGSLSPLMKAAGNYTRQLSRAFDGISDIRCQRSARQRKQTETDFFTQIGVILLLMNKVFKFFTNKFQLITIFFRIQ